MNKETGTRFQHFATGDKRFLVFRWKNDFSKDKSGPYTDLRVINSY
jgi:hypothetical protein